MNITVESLLEAGYTRYPDGKDSDFCKGLYQKAIRTPDGKALYFLNFYRWEFPSGPCPSWAVEARLYKTPADNFDENGDIKDALKEESFDLNLLLHGDPPVADVELFYKIAYERLGCCPDLHN
jgi:hypothetical protein